MALIVACYPANVALNKVYTASVCSSLTVCTNINVVYTESLLRIVLTSLSFRPWVGFPQGHSQLWWQTLEQVNVQIVAITGMCMRGIPRKAVSSYSQNPATFEFRADLKNVQCSSNFLETEFVVPPHEQRETQSCWIHGCLDFLENGVLFVELETPRTGRVHEKLEFSIKNSKFS